MSRQTMKITMIFSILIFASGCVGTLNLDDPSESVLSELAYPAPDDRLKVLRSAHFARAIAWYGARSVTTYSQGPDEKEKDAYSILKKMQSVQTKLSALRIKTQKGESITATERFTYVEDVLEMMGKAVLPTKRYYENNFMARIADQNPIAAAITFKEALMGFFEVKSSHDKYKSAIRAEFVGLFPDAQTITKAEVNTNWNIILNDLKIEPKDLGSVVEAERKWYRKFRFEKKEVETISGLLKENKRPKEWLLQLATVVTSQKSKPTLHIDKDKLSAAWNSATKKFNEYCGQLKKVAGDAANNFECKLGE
jgi:hypothetical protein